MKAVKANLLYDGKASQKDVYIEFDGNTIKNVSQKKPECDIVAEGIVTPAFIDPHSHIGLDRAGEPGSESEANDKLDSMIPLGRAVDGVYMDDHAFRESVESGVLYSVVLPGSGNIIGGMGSLLRNFSSNIKDAFVNDIGVKMALGYNPRSTTEWKGKRPTTRMGVGAIIREKFTMAQKTSNLLDQGKKTIDEIDVETEFLIKLIKGEYRIMCHLHKEDDALFLMSLVDKFGIKPIINHGMDFHSKDIFEEIKRRDLSLVYGPLDSHPYKVELKHESWRNVGLVQNSGVRFSLISDHPVILQRTLFLTTRHFMRFGATKEQCVSYVSSRPAEILGLNDLGTVEKGKLASFSVWNKDPFELDAYPKSVFGEGKLVHEEN
ncbi:MAG: amidohydrolase [Candidatus Thermoplasmatota archaeon]|jgi:imidazolonepropionase-like amidohydrolase|nr:amidohydrolase [Candidatus Thermoplasmatota archaeon]